MATRKAASSKSTAGAALRVTLVKSVNGRLRNHKACVTGLGLRRINHTVTVADTPENRGMINTVSYLLRVEEG
jgi:large subunit ribosomal protein L30